MRIPGRMPRPIRRLARDERGSVFVWLVATTALIGGVMGMAIDASYLYSLQSRLQATADSAALAGVSQLPNLSGAREVAKDYAGKNMPASEHGAVLADSDIRVGDWDAVTRTFTTNSSGNALRVVARRSASNNNAAETFFARLLGFESVDMGASAIAMRINQECFLQGIVAGGNVDFSQNATVTGGSCVYGATVHFDQNGTVEDDAFIASDDIANITWDSGFTYPSGGLVETSVDTSAAVNAAGRIDDIENGVNLPPQITSVQVVASLPDPLVSGTAYVVNGDLAIDKSTSATDNIIAVRGSVHWGKNGQLVNTAGACNGGEASIGVVATGDIHFGKESVTQGVQVISGGNVQIDQLATFEGAIMAAGDVNINQAPTFTQCEDAFGSNIPLIAKLVD